MTNNYDGTNMERCSITIRRVSLGELPNEHLPISQVSKVACLMNIPTQAKTQKRCLHALQQQQFGLK